MDDIIRHIKESEGFRSKVYKCPAGKLTIGYGRNVDPDGGKGITNGEAYYMLLNDVEECIRDLQSIFGFKLWNSTPKEWKFVLTDMRFNLGYNRFRGFKKMIAYLKLQAYDKAVDEMIDSDWLKQVGDRSKKLLAMVENWR